MNTVIIDEHEVIHIGVREFLANSSFDVVAHCRSLSDYSQVMAAGASVDLILTEATIGGLGPYPVIEAIKKQSGDAKLVIFSEFPSLVRHAERLGADGFIVKAVRSFEFVKKLEDLQRYGSLWTSPACDAAASV